MAETEGRRIKKPVFLAHFGHAHHKVTVRIDGRFLWYTIGLAGFCQQLCRSFLGGQTSSAMCGTGGRMCRRPTYGTRRQQGGGNSPDCKAGDRLPSDTFSGEILTGAWNSCLRNGANGSPRTRTELDWPAERWPAWRCLSTGDGSASMNGWAPPRSGKPATARRTAWGCRPDWAPQERPGGRALSRWRAAGGYHRGAERI